jgi:hypothetical protein
MAEACENLQSCGFFKKHSSVSDLACKWYVREYCNGSMQNRCKRKLYKQEHGTPPSDDMLPNGQMAVSADVAPPPSA